MDALLRLENVAYDRRVHWPRRSIRGTSVPHSPQLVSAAFDDLNLVSCAGLAPVLALAERCSLAELVAGKLTPHLPISPLVTAGNAASLLWEPSGLTVPTRPDGTVQGRARDASGC